MRKVISLIVLSTIVFLLPNCSLLNREVKIKADANSNKLNSNGKSSFEQLTDKYFKLVEINGMPVDSDNAKEPHLILSSEDYRISGTGGCNSFSGSFLVNESNKIQFMHISTTRMACPNMETDAALYSVLEVADNYILDGDTLIINRAKTAPQAKFIAVSNL